LITSSSVPASTREWAISLLGNVPWNESQHLVRELLSPSSSLEDQRRALRAIGKVDNREAAELVLSLWPAWSPAIRRDAQEVLLSRTLFIQSLLDHAEQKKFTWQQLDQVRREQLLRSRTASIRQRAAQLQASLNTSSQKSVLSRYQPALRMAANLEQGKKLFGQHCSTCHALQGQGHAVGPDLLGALGNKTPEALLIDLFDPNREVDPRYINYLVVTKNGRTVTGIMSSESAGSVTLKRAEGIEETILRSDLEEVQGTGKSLMPENLHEQLSIQDAADLMGYLLSLRSRK
jgi:putative heme-binding domain-containing protein